jgi:hypothetical protein
LNQAIETHAADVSRLKEQAGSLEAQLNAYRASRWVELGRKLGLGPKQPAS